MQKETNETLLIRIDERQKEVLHKVQNIETEMKTTVKEDENFKNLNNKVKTLWDDRNKIIGWVVGAGVVGGSTANLICNGVKSLFAKW